MDTVALVIRKIVVELFNVDQNIQLSRPDSQFGDFATNVAMQLAKPMDKNPREIAEQLAEKLRENTDFSDVSVAGPGFLNLRVKDSSLTDELTIIIDNPSDSGKSKLYENKILVTEYSDPNPFKVLHVGHF